MNITQKHNRIYVSFDNGDSATLCRMEHCFESGQSWVGEASLEEYLTNDTYYQWELATLGGKKYSQSKYGFLVGELVIGEDVNLAENRWFEETIDLNTRIAQEREFHLASLNGKCAEVFNSHCGAYREHCFW